MNNYRSICIWIELHTSCAYVSDLLKKRTILWELSVIELDFAGCAVCFRLTKKNRLIWVICLWILHFFSCNPRGQLCRTACFLICVTLSFYPLISNCDHSAGNGVSDTAYIHKQCFSLDWHEIFFCLFFYFYICLIFWTIWEKYLNYSNNFIWDR